MNPRGKSQFWSLPSTGSTYVHHSFRSIYICCKEGPLFFCNNCKKENCGNFESTGAWTWWTFTCDNTIKTLQSAPASIIFLSKTALKALNFMLFYFVYWTLDFLIPYGEVRSTDLCKATATARAALPLSYHYYIVVVYSLPSVLQWRIGNFDKTARQTSTILLRFWPTDCPIFFLRAQPHVRTLVRHAVGQSVDPHPRD